VAKNRIAPTTTIASPRGIPNDSGKIVLLSIFNEQANIPLHPPPT
jgi:hypothetical protein